MMDVLLTRTERKPDGTFGAFQLQKDGQHVVSFYSMEDDWLDNQPRISCIPVGTYRLERTIYHRRGIETFEVVGVPSRSRILIHPANAEEDVEGCIGIGMRFGKLRVAKDEDTGAEGVMKYAVVESGKAFARFMDLMNGLDESRITVRWVAGLP